MTVGRSNSHSFIILTNLHVILYQGTVNTWICCIVHLCNSLVLCFIIFIYSKFILSSINFGLYYFSFIAGHFYPNIYNFSKLIILIKINLFDFRSPSIYFIWNILQISFRILHLNYCMDRIGTLSFNLNCSS